MTTATFPVAPAARPRHRALGAVALLAAPAFFGPTDGRVASLLGLWYLTGWACSAVAIRRDRATGSGRGAAAIFAIQIVGLALAAGQQIQDYLQRRPLGDTVYGICDAAWPLSHLFMLVVGVAVLRAGVWRGWRRWTPLACGLALPIALAAGAALGRPALTASFPMLTTLAFGALAIAVLGAPAQGSTYEV
jgi:hypothetical protein